VSTISIPGSSNVDITVYGPGTVIAGNGNDRIDITGQGSIIVGSGHDTLTLNTTGVISQAQWRLSTTTVFPLKVC
jgi:hypothetical protein